MENKLVVIIGVGFVGQHLVDVFCRRHRVIGFDVNPKRVAALKDVYGHNPNVTIQDTTEGLDTADLICISVPTLLKDNNTAIDSSYVETAVQTVSQHARPGCTVVSAHAASRGRSGGAVPPAPSHRAPALPA
jgi:UDP-N-acetyl-D-mannosaminuronate dehydrogenase